MPNRVSANLLKAQGKATAAFQSSELRYRVPSTYLAIKAMTPTLIPNLEAEKTREDRAVEVLYFKRNKRTLLTTDRQHTHSFGGGDTDVLTPTWVTRCDGFGMTLKQADNNHYNAQEQMNREVGDVVSNFAESLETMATAYLFNNRTGVNVANYNGTFDATDDVFEILEANKDLSIQTTEMAMDANAYPKGSIVFADSKAYGMFLYQKNQGGGNSENTAYQFDMNGITIIHCIGLGALASGLASAYSKGFWICVPYGSVGTWSWIPRQNRIGVSTKVGEYSNIINPITSDVLAVHSHVERVDGTAVNGMTQDEKTDYEFSMDINFSKAPLSTASETPIFAFGIV